MIALDDNELDRKRRMFPLLMFTRNDYGGVNVSSPRRLNSHFGLSGDWQKDDKWCAEQHLLLSMEQYLSDMYPHLWFQVSVDRSGIMLSMWVLHRDERGQARDGVAIGHISNVLDPALHKQIEYHNTEAYLASQEGWFYCSGHNRAEQGKRAWYHFAGSYCAKYGDEHPDARAAAQRETYR